jgi:uncharacterized protein YutE (UPF0331/DUF86 family)
LVSSEIIGSRLKKLTEYIQLLEKLKLHPKKAFLEDPFVYGNVERYLQLSIQVVIDISNHILSERNINGLKEYRDMIIGLGKEGLIPEELAAKIAPMAGLRNLLVHEYVEIDHEKLFDIIQRQLGDFKDFAKHISKLL